ncbi:MAG: AlpA family phage regulatory protein [Zoogloeaceae bacterium]|jgi:prophage regulatory protein|nr:AlpA family phage regulatory protein [Zoogloeaceae bacterium]
MAAQIQTTPTILRRRQVEVRTGLSCSSIYDKLNPKCRWYDSTFPRPINLGPRAVGWLSGEIDAWIKSRIEASRGEA